jgi:hypothetical protein
LLLAKLKTVLRKLNTTLSVLTGGITPSLKGTLFSETAISLQEELLIFTPTDSTNRTT